MRGSSNPYGCYDRRFLVELLPTLIAIAIALVLAVTLPRTPGLRLALAGLGCGGLAWAIVVSVAAIRRLDELQRHVQLVAIAIAFAATGVLVALRQFFELLGVEAYPSGIGIWIFMSVVWSVAVVVLHRRYR